MHNVIIIVVAGLFFLPACSSNLTPPQPVAVSKETQLACEQEALIAQQSYLARIKTPTYTSSRSTTWAGGARTDNGKWVFDSTLQSCMLRAQQSATVQP